MAAVTVVGSQVLFRMPFVPSTQCLVPESLHERSVTAGLLQSSFCLYTTLLCLLRDLFEWSGYYLEILYTFIITKTVLHSN